MVLRLAGGEMKGRKREGGRDKGRGRERVRVRWIGIGGDCVMFERRRRDRRERRDGKVGERWEEGAVRMRRQRKDGERWWKERKRRRIGKKVARLDKNLFKLNGNLIQFETFSQLGHHNRDLSRPLRNTSTTRIKRTLAGDDVNLEGRKCPSTH